MMILLVEVKVKPESLDDFLKLIKDDAVHSEGDEPGCLRFDVLRDTEDPTHFFYYEVYRDEAARLAHRETPHFTHYAQNVSAYLDGEPVRRLLTNFHPSDGEWR